MKDPYLDKVMYGWIVKTSNQELWRVARWYALDDLVQDGLLCFYRCRAAYPKFGNRPTPTKRRHFMALVQATFRNHINTLARKKYLDPVTQNATEEQETTFANERATFQEGPLRILLRNAPQEVIEVLLTLALDATEPLRVRRGRRLVREITNERLSRVLGLPPADFVTMVTKYLR